MTMHARPECPNCGDEILRLQATPHSIMVSCGECGWRAAIALPVDNVEAAIARAVAHATVRELAADWPTMDNIPVGRDMFPHLPITGEQP